ncbi:MAG: saccharopine dehydrogenase C-terminal domain-containing protein [candidate division Zixibacteria bacterium]|nr:saccharopine dehydrogenase C-terminal domain-containing protein [candidate division Zixibacteria bacterium]
MKIAVIGAGLMGRAAVADLGNNSEITKVGVFDIDKKLASDIAERYGSGKAVASFFDASDTDAAEKILSEYDAAVSCVTYKYNPGLTNACINAKCHMVDLGGNNDVVNTQLEMNDEAEKAGVLIIPDCGLAPGMVSILTMDGYSKFDSVNSIKIRVGGLPQSPRKPLNYMMVFSAEGLINEYWEPCVILKGGKKTNVNPMTEIEELKFEGVGQLEAFYTSGGTSTLPNTFSGKVDFLDYKTIRYPGHCKLFKPMLEIGLASRQKINVDDQQVEPRAVFKAVLDKNLSYDELDMVLVRVTFNGLKDGAEKEIVYDILDRQQNKTSLTAMMRMTAFPATIIATLAASGRLEKTGCIPQELAVKPSLFIPELKKRNINLVIK